MFSIPADIYNPSKTYLLIITNFFTLNSYIKVLAYFLKSDGRAKLTLDAVLIANILNLALDFLLFGVFGQKIEGIAFALVLGYLVSAVYVSKYYFEKDSAFKLISPFKFTLKDIYLFGKSSLHASPELIARIFLAVKTTVLVYLCAKYLGDVGLLAFLVYDNLETLVYLFVSGLTKTISPFLTLFYNEQDYPSVEYIIKLSTKHILIFILSLSTLFFIFPEILLNLFSITMVEQQTVIALAIRITSIGLIGRCLCMIIADYARAISSFRISALINFLREGFLPFILLLIFIPSLGGLGIWITLSLSDIMPVIVYGMIILYRRRQYPNLKNNALMIPKLVSFHWTSIRGNLKKWMTICRSQIRRLYGILKIYLMMII